MRSASLRGRNRSTAKGLRAAITLGQRVHALAEELQLR
jgi:hypothetical protein